MNRRNRRTSDSRRPTKRTSWRPGLRGLARRSCPHRCWPKRALVNAQLQPLAMNIGGQGRDAARELGGVPLKISTAVAPVHPAVVDVDVLVSDRRHAARNERVSDSLDQGLAWAASKGVPRVPAHGWSRADRRRATPAASACRPRRPSSRLPPCRRPTPSLPHHRARTVRPHRQRHLHHRSRSSRPSAGVPRPLNRLDRPSPPGRLTPGPRRLLGPRCPTCHRCRLRHRSLRRPNHPGPSKPSVRRRRRWRLSRRSPSKPSVRRRRRWRLSRRSPSPRPIRQFGRTSILCPKLPAEPRP